MHFYILAAKELANITGDYSQGASSSESVEGDTIMMKGAITRYILNFSVLLLKPAILVTVVGHVQAEPVAAPTLRQTLPASWDENWLGSPAVFDLDNDGDNEIIASRHSVTYVWDSSGALVWRAPVGEESSSTNDHGSSRQYASPVVGDFDGDGDGEIAIGYSNSVAVYEHNGFLLPGWPQTFPGSSGEIRSIAAADLDQDGSVEILAVKTSSGPVTVAYHLDGSVVTGWPQAQNCDKCNDYGGYNQNIGAVDLDGDNLPEVISTYDISHIGIMYGDGSPVMANEIFWGTPSDPEPASGVPMFHDLSLAIQGWGSDGNDRDEFTVSPPVFGDLDGDGLPEVILYSDHELVGEYVTRGNCLWVLNPDMTRVAGFESPICSGMPLHTGFQDNIVQVAPAPALADIAGDSRLEIIVPSYDGIMRAYTPNGTLLWSYTFDTSGGDFIGATGAVVGDLNSDGVVEIIFCTYSISQSVSHLIILDAAGMELHKILLAKRGTMGPPTLADVDQDGDVEIVISLKDTLGGGLGGVQIWDVTTAMIGKLPWPTGRGNMLRNGQLIQIIPAPEPDEFPWEIFMPAILNSTR